MTLKALKGENQIGSIAANARAAKAKAQANGTFQPQPDKATARPVELYRYSVCNNMTEIASCAASTADKAAEDMGLRVEFSFSGSAVVQNKKGYRFGMTWKPIMIDAEHAALLAVAEDSLHLLHELGVGSKETIQKAKVQLVERHNQLDAATSKASTVNDDPRLRWPGYATACDIAKK